MLEVAIALAARPSLLLLDEPVSGMNPSETASFMKMIDKIREREITILLVANKSGVGAMVKVFAGDDVYTKMHHGKSGYLAQSLYPLYFGLGSNKKIDKIEVAWPSGKTQVIDRKIELNRVLEITEPK